MLFHISVCASVSAKYCNIIGLIYYIYSTVLPFNNIILLVSYILCGLSFIGLIPQNIIDKIVRVTLQRYLYKYNHHQPHDADDLSMVNIILN